ncbi:MAG TPA: DUF6443 domain-containing protein [Bacteroidales bacterium]|nr:DUF6443 domain-containing protein [Bacteroidales bacterium]
MIEQVQYFDGLGRIIQTIDIKGSPERNDIVMPVDYDKYGRESFKYLPYSKTGDGGYRPNAITTSGEQSVFYSNSGNLNGLDETDTRAYSEITYENSPLNRTLFQQGPGSDWTGKKSGFEYISNSASSVIRWQVNSANACTRNGYYTVNTLLVNRITDEDGNKTSEYKDLQGKVVLKETELGTKTYYVYDDLDLLRYVIPPEATSQVGSGSLTSTISSNYCYYYQYDCRKRMIKKKLPGADTVYMVYDIRDRLVATQDGLQRSKTPKEWSFIKYDAFNRPVLTGIIPYAGSRNDLQTIVNSYTGINLYETKTTSSTHHYYTQNSFPNSSYTKTYNTITYYDGYDFNGDNSPDKAYVSDGMTDPGSGTRKGLTTGTKMRIINDASTLFVETVTFYDKYGHTVQAQHTQPIEAITINTRTSNKINLIGEVLQAKTTTLSGSTVINTVQDEYTLDHRARLLEIKKTINSEPATVIVNNSYNQLGQLIAEKLGVTDGIGLQKVDYLYNIRGWLRGLNNTPESSDLFAMQLFYNDYLSNLDLTKGNFNGNISSAKWTNKGLSGIWKAYGFAYDKLNRLNNAIYGEYSQGGSNINTGYRGNEYKNRFDEYGISYDLNGNIKTLRRKGIDNPSTLTYAEIDSLNYAYTGNQLRKVNDAIPDITGRGDFSEKVTNTREYLYDANGNMYKDDNKGVYNINYNFLNLPTKVYFTASNDYITYLYDAGGNKLKKIVVKGGTTQFTENYAGNVVFKTTGTGTFSPTNDLHYINTEKGRLVKSGSTFVYEYYLTDHLGNTRAVFSDVNKNGTIENNSTEILQYADYYPFGMLHNHAATTTDDNRRLYNGKELQSETFNLDGTSGDETMFDWYDYGARFYDPQLGRWQVIDPMSEKYLSITPYNYCFNNPFYLTDPNGEDVFGIFYKYENEYDENGDLKLDENNQPIRKIVGVSIINLGSENAKKLIDDLNNSEAQSFYSAYLGAKMTELGNSIISEFENSTTNDAYFGFMEKVPTDPDASDVSSGYTLTSDFLTTLSSKFTASENIDKAKTEDIYDILKNSYQISIFEGMKIVNPDRNNNLIALDRETYYPGVPYFDKNNQYIDDHIIKLGTIIHELGAHVAGAAHNYEQNIHHLVWGQNESKMWYQIKKLYGIK